MLDESIFCLDEKNDRSINKFGGYGFRSFSGYGCGIGCGSGIHYSVGREIGKFRARVDDSCKGIGSGIYDAHGFKNSTGCGEGTGDDLWLQL